MLKCLRSKRCQLSNQDKFNASVMRQFFAILDK